MSQDIPQRLSAFSGVVWNTKYGILSGEKKPEEEVSAYLSVFNFLHYIAVTSSLFGCIFIVNAICYKRAPLSHTVHGFYRRNRPLCRLLILQDMKNYSLSSLRMRINTIVALGNMHQGLRSDHQVIQWRAHTGARAI